METKQGNILDFNANKARELSSKAPAQIETILNDIKSISEKGGRSYYFSESLEPMVYMDLIKRKFRIDEFSVQHRDNFQPKLYCQISW